jgi:hypothetical protein
MAESKHTYWSRQIDGLARELSRLAIACDIELGKDGLAERVLKNDETIESEGLSVDKKTPDGPVLG